MEWAIAYAASVFGLAYALPKLWMIQAQERLVQTQIDALTTTSETVGTQSEINWDSLDGPYQ